MYTYVVRCRYLMKYQGAKINNWFDSQVVECRKGILEALGSNPSQAWYISRPMLCYQNVAGAQKIGLNWDSNPGPREYVLLLLFSREN